jgi:hypothetical protein
MTDQTRERSFDALARGLASGEVSRGKALRLMGAALVGGTLGSLGIGEAAAAPPAPRGCKRDGKKCKEGSQCCSGNCSSGSCQAQTLSRLDCSCQNPPVTFVTCIPDCRTALASCTPQCSLNGGVASVVCTPGC